MPYSVSFNYNYIYFCTVVFYIAPVVVVDNNVAVCTVFCRFSGSQVCNRFDLHPVMLNFEFTFSSDRGRFCNTHAVCSGRSSVSQNSTESPAVQPALLIFLQQHK